MVQRKRKIATIDDSLSLSLDVVPLVHDGVEGGGLAGGGRSLNGGLGGSGVHLGAAVELRAGPGEALVVAAVDVLDPLLVALLQDAEGELLVLGLAVEGELVGGLA